MGAFLIQPDGSVDAAHRAALQQRLVAWYHEHRRDLPWRNDPPDPYRVLVSEAMLQQTQVTTVVDYFQRFMHAWPTVESLAAADEQQVLRQWQGLGYYRRARNLHAAARRIVEEFDGQVPRRVDQLLSLPGVGRYTAGAIASIAYGEPAPILDGNVVRVLARLFAIEQAVDDTAVRKRLWDLAGQLVPEEEAGAFNQALMELGALVCTPGNPRCLHCPVTDRCAAASAGAQDRLPLKGARREPLAVTHHVIAVRKAGAYLFEQRPESGLWSRMWQLPTWEEPDEAVEQIRLLHWLDQRFGVEVHEPAKAASFEHRTTHRRIQFLLWRAEVSGGRLRSRAGQWRRLDELDDLPLANPQRKAVALLG